MIIKLSDPIKITTNDSTTSKNILVKELKVELKKGVDSFSYILEGVTIIKKAVGEHLEMFNKAADYSAKMQEVTLNFEEKEKMKQYEKLKKSTSSEPTLNDSGRITYIKEDKVVDDTSYEIFKKTSSRSYVELSNFIKESLLSQVFLDVSLVGCNKEFDEEILNKISHIDRVNIIKQFFLVFFSDIMNS